MVIYTKIHIRKNESKHLVKWVQWDETQPRDLLNFQDIMQLHNATQYYITGQFC